MKTYMTPDVFVTEFQANVAVAACSWYDTGEDSTSWPKQQITCGQSGRTEYVFASTSTCDHALDQAVVIAPVSGWISVATLQSWGLTIRNSDTPLYVTEGDYLVSWSNGDHYGIATPDIVDILTHST